MSELEMCQYMECKNIATGWTTVRKHGFLITIINCDKHIDESFELLDKLDEI